MNEITNTVTIRLVDFLQMRDDANYLDILLDVIFNTSEYGIYSGILKVNSDDVNTALKFIAPERYKKRLAELKAEEED